jgi:two-component system response regulator DegU
LPEPHITENRLLSELKHLKVDVVLMDINMPEMDGIEATKLLKKTHPDLKILMLTMHSEPRFIKECLEIGAKGYVLKNISKDDLLKAIDTVYQDKSYLDQDSQEKLISSMSNTDEEDDRNYDELAAQITQRELEILQLIALRFNFSRYCYQIIYQQKHGGNAP